MDTHLVTHPDVHPDTARFSARLPGELENAGHTGKAEPVRPPEMDAAAKTEARSDVAPGTVEPAPAAAPAPARLPRRRRRLLAGGALLTLTAAGAGAFLVSPYNTLYPMPKLANEAHNAVAEVHNVVAEVKDRLRPILAPAASLAGVTVPEMPPVTRDHYTAKPKDAAVGELLSLHPAWVPSSVSDDAPQAPPPQPAKRPVRVISPAPGGRLSSGVAVVPPVPEMPAGYVPSEPGSASVVRVAKPAKPTPALAPAVPGLPATPQDVTTAVAAALSQAQGPSFPASVSVAPAPAPASPASPAPASATVAPAEASAGNAPVVDTADAAPVAKRDPVETASLLRPAPMSPPDQVEVVGMVTEMASMVKDMRKQDAALRTDFAKSTSAAAARIADFERRLAVAEAKNAMASARADVKAEDAPPVRTTADDAATGPGVRSTPVSVTRVSATAPATTGVPPGAKGYRVQAASPGLALLAQVDRGGGDGAQLQVVVGDIIPDYGRVKAIAQKGTAWVVTTDRGAIQ